MTLLLRFGCNHVNLVLRELPSLGQMCGYGNKCLEWTEQHGKAREVVCAVYDVGQTNPELLCHVMGVPGHVVSYEACLPCKVVSESHGSTVYRGTQRHVPLIKSRLEAHFVLVMVRKYMSNSRLGILDLCW